MNLHAPCAILRAALLGATLVITSTCHAQGAAEPAQVSRFRFANQDLNTLLIGEWKGTLKMREPLLAGIPGDPANTSDMPMRIVIERDKALVFIEDKGEQIEVLQGELGLIPIGPIGIISGSSYDTSDGKHASWFESIAILVNLQSDDVLVAEWRRAVSNVRKGTKATPAFSVAFGGTLQRITPYNKGEK